LLARAAKQSGDASLRDIVLESAAVMYGIYVRTALRANPDHEDTKGFYQWGSMAFYELYTAGWPNTEPYAARTIAMARWMIDVHGVLERSRNTGYAYEGLAVAWELARLTNDRKSQQHIRAAIEKGLPRLIAWQIGGPIPGPAVPATFLRSDLARGGVLSAAGDPRLRVDMTQHQMHATMMIRYLLFQPDAAAADGR
jgi:UDP-N-acetylmuramoyl-tripeptide--D-alanyl-D-alanine ligase